jgi:hypothetical protein
MDLDVVYHVLAVNHWQSVVREQLALLLRNQHVRSLSITLAIPPAPTMVTASGLKFQFAGDAHERRLLDIHADAWRTNAGEADAGHDAPSPPKLQIRRSPMDRFEHPALEWVETLAGASDGLILYFHAKGVSHCPADPRIERWRQHLNQLLVAADAWALQLQRSAADVAGPCLLIDEQRQSTYFAGNFWMAKCAYLRSLPSYRSFVDSPPTGWCEPGSRFLAELAVNRAGTMQALAIDGMAYSRSDIAGL